MLVFTSKHQTALASQGDLCVWGCLWNKDVKAMCSLQSTELNQTEGKGPIKSAQDTSRANG